MNEINSQIHIPHPAQQISIQSIQIELLEHLKQVMLPQARQFNVLQVFQMCSEYCIKQPNLPYISLVQKYLHQLQSMSLIQTPNLKVSCSQSQSIQDQRISIQITKIKTKLAVNIIDHLRGIFLHYHKQTLSYEEINTFVLSSQMKIFKNLNSLEHLSQYQNLTQRRIRLDQNVKLCIMPQGDSTKIKTLVITPNQQNQEHPFQKQIFAVTMDHVQRLKLNSHKIGKEKKNSTSLIKDWYHYSYQKIVPYCKQQQSKLTKLHAKRQIYIQKVSMGNNLMGMITYQKQILIQPLIKQNQMYLRGRKNHPSQLLMGNLLLDVPLQNYSSPLLSSSHSSPAQVLKQSRVLLFQNINEELWIVANQHFIYVYYLPLKKQIQEAQHNGASRLLCVCETLPVKATQAKMLTNQYMVVMCDNPCVIVWKLQLSAKQDQRHKSNIYSTNKIYNDIKYICMDYHPVQKYLIFTDFGGYLIRHKFNIATGDLQKEGATYDEKTGKFLTQNQTITKRWKQFSALKMQSQINLKNAIKQLQSNPSLISQAAKQQKSVLSPVEKNSSLTIFTKKGSSLAQLFLANKKPSHIQSQDRSGISLYAKPQDTDHIKIVHNNTRQNMILLCLNKDNSTLVTYEEATVNAINKTTQQTQNNKQMIYGKTIKLWDIHYLTVYQTFTLSLQISYFCLQSNGLYIVTKERGYLGFYPVLNTNQKSHTNKQNQLKQTLNKDKKAFLSSRISIQKNKLFFSTQLGKQKDLSKLQSACYQNHMLNYSSAITKIYSLSFSSQSPLCCLQQVPCTSSQICIKNKLYLLVDTSADKKYNLNIYDTFGNKQTVLSGSKRTLKYGIRQNYQHISKVNHSQFNIVMWNKHSFMFVGNNLEESFTIHWTMLSDHQLKLKPQNDRISLKSSNTKKDKTIQKIHVADSCLGIVQKIQNDMVRQISLSIFHLESGRVKYRINDITGNIQILSMFNSMLLTKYSKQLQSSTSNFQYQSFQTPMRSSKQKMFSSRSIMDIGDYQFINLYDLKSPLQRKCIFTLKFRKLIEQTMSIEQIGNYMKNSNAVLAQDKFFVHKSISLINAEFFTINQGTNIILSMSFKYRTSIVQKINNNKRQKSKQKSQQKSEDNSLKVHFSSEIFYIYSRQISQQVFNRYNYHPSLQNSSITKVNKKSNSQYTGQTQVNERIVGHWEINQHDLLARSNCKNFHYEKDLHYQHDENVNVKVEDITYKIVKFNQQYVYKRQPLNKYQNITRLFNTQSKAQAQQLDTNIQWIQKQFNKSKSIICISNKHQFQLYQQQIMFLPKQSQQRMAMSQRQENLLRINLVKICKVQVNKSENPNIVFWNKDFQNQNQELWQEAKKDMLNYIQTNLKSDNIKNRKKSINHNKNKSIQKQKSLQNFPQLKNSKLKTIQPNYLFTPSIQKQQIKLQTSSNALNSLFRHWQISKKIKKQHEQHEKIISQNIYQKTKQIEEFIYNPQKQVQRIQFLVGLNKKIKNIQDNQQININLLNLKSTIQQNLLNPKSNISQNSKLTIQQHTIKQVSQNILKNTKTNQLRLQQLSVKLEKSLQKLIVSKYISDKQSILLKNEKIQKKSSINKRVINSSMSKYEDSQKSTMLNSPAISPSRKGLLSKLKTQASQHSYLNQIPQSPLSLKKQNLSSQKNQHQQFSKIQHLSSAKKQSLKQQNFSQSQHSSIFSLVKIPSVTILKPIQQHIIRCQTEQSQASLKDPAMQLKCSQSFMKQSVLPQIIKNRQKLNQKMKEKKSFIQIVNQRLKRDDKSKW